MSSQKCISKTHSGYPSYRKVVNPSGRLGSLYDIESDRVIDQYSAQQYFTKTFGDNKRTTCKLILGQRTKKASSYLELMGFKHELRHNLDIQNITPVGVSRLAEYLRPINERTRFLYFCFRHRQDKIEVKGQKAQRVIPPPREATEATHAITKIIWGFEFVIVIGIPANLSPEPIDNLLRSLQNRLINWREPIRLTRDENQFLSSLDDVSVYGTETCIEDVMMPISVILASVRDWQNDNKFFQPVEYVMQPLRWLYRDPHYPVRPTPKRVDPEIERIDPLLDRVSHQIENLGQRIERLPNTFPSATLNQNLRQVRQNYQYLLDTQDTFKHQLKRAEVNVRHQKLPASEIGKIISNNDFQCLRKENIEKNDTIAERLLSKAKLIEHLNKDQIEYTNAVDIYPNSKAASTTIDQVIGALEKHFINPNYDVMLWFVGDRLRREQADRWERLYREMISERSKINAGRPIQLFYVDFSDVTPSLREQNITYLPAQSSLPHRPTNIPIEMNPPKNGPRPTPMPPPPRPPAVSQTEINVLILGETGVGKSTFINAFVNYLAFHTFERAEDSEPIALIPVSFITTMNDRFEEVTVRFGPANANEFHNAGGQSVTQDCRSYAFDIDAHTRLRLIDTPGLGDTRGLEQDRKHVDRILSYANNYSHINAICLLFKPNSSRLDIVFRYCIRELFKLFPPVVQSQLFFCFTNSRSTFYAPGNTGQLIKAMLQQENLTMIPFGKENVFCFDSESFRYLIAKRVGVQMDRELRPEFIQSWKKSVTESKRFQQRLCNMKPIYFHRALTIRQLRYEIIKLARPLMETLRLIVYNWKLREANIISHQINIKSNPITIDLCTNCAETDIASISPFLITQYRMPHYDHRHHLHQQCPENDEHHFLIECLVEHETNPAPAGISKERWESSLQNFLLKCDQLAYFLYQQGLVVEEDPFTRVLNRFIDEEQTIVNTTHLQTSINRRILQELLNIQPKRQNNLRQLASTNEQLKPENVKQIIDELLHVETVRRLIDSVDKTRQLKINADELKINFHRIYNERMDDRFEIPV